MSSINSNSYNVLFISEQTIKDNSVLNQNIDTKLLKPTIKLAQEKYLLHILGTALYSDLQDKIKDNTLSSDETFLLQNYIQPIIIWGITKEFSIYLSYKYMNKGVERQGSVDSTPPTLEELQFLANKEDSNLQWYSKRLVEYLKANRTLFTKYDSETLCDDIRPTCEPYKSRLFLGNQNYKKHKYNHYRHR